MTRPTLLTISKEALRHNYQRVKYYAPNAKVMLPVKCDAYGHGIADVVNSLPDCDAFAVACLEEATVVRENTQQPIIILEGLFHADEIKTAAEINCQIIVHCEDQLRMLELHKGPETFIVWLKINTGMCRLGISCEDYHSYVSRLSDCETVSEIRLMTHFANADDVSDPFTHEQINRFYQTIDKTKHVCSLANSGAVIGWPDSHANWVRPGIMVYGISPMKDHIGKDHDLIPAMSLTTQFIAVNHCRAGDRVGYTGQFTCPENMKIATAALGYGDGYPRILNTGTPVIVNGIKTQVVGQVSMDLIAIDCRPLINPQIGDEVLLWGKGLPLEYLAKRAQTLSYEILCNVHPRIKRSLV